MNKRVIMVLIIACIAITRESNSSTLSQLLSAYCVPTDASKCSGKERATFTGTSATTDAISKNYCECSEDNMYYDKEERRCKNCLDYEFTSSNRETKCSPIYCKYTGDYPIKVEECPAGYEKIEYLEYIK